MNWREIPMARLLFSLILGISLGSCFEDGQLGSCTSLLMVICLPILLGFQQRMSYGKRWWYGILLLLFFSLMGFTLTLLQKRIHAPYMLEPGHQIVTGTILDISLTPRKCKIKLDINGSDSTGIGQKGYLLLYLNQSIESSLLKQGDIIAAEGDIKEVPGMLNPHTFDYKNYLAKHQIYHQLFVRDNNWHKIGHQFSLTPIAEGWRQYLLAILEEHLPGKNEYAVGAALCMGYKSELSDDLRNAYANTGAMHILAVSGLHVGIVQMMISWLLGLLPFTGFKWKVITTLITILAIWSFAIMTGAAPSVLRAATMFSFLSVGIALHRTTNIYNTLAASAFLLLCINPMLLFEVGFQLSYLAVLGIVYLQPKIYRLWYIKHKAGDYAWQLIAVSIAAQIITFPLSIYYFHQFPVYFLLSGLVAIPAAFIILSLSLFLFSIHWVPALAVLCGKLLYAIVFITNTLIFSIQKLPGGLLNGLSISWSTLILLYMILFCLAIALHSRQYKWLLGALSFLLIIAIQYSCKEWKAFTQQAVVIYQVNQESLIDYFDGKTIHTLHQNIDPKTIRFVAQPHRWYRRAVANEALSFQSDTITSRYIINNEYFLLGPYRLFIPSNSPPRDYSITHEIDVLLIRATASNEAAEWLKYLRPGQVVIDGSVGYQQAREWLEACQSLNLSVHNTRYDGAFTLSKN